MKIYLFHKDIFSNSRTHHSSSTYTKGGKKYYKVRSGDTLGAISRRHGTSVSRICQLNGMKATDILNIGQSIRVR